MRIPRIYLSQPLAVGSTVTLDDRAFQHVVRVLRLKVGAPLVLFNGDGGAFTAHLTVVGKREAVAQIAAAVLPTEGESPLRIVLAQGLSRGDRMDYTVQKAVELGVSAIQPLLTARTDDRLVRKMPHWQGILISACEQCGRNQLPTLCTPIPLAAWLARSKISYGLLLDPLADRGLRQLEKPSSTITLLIGPEGGLTPDELAQAKAAGFTGVRLGPRVLRTETAGMAALAAIQALWGDFE